MLLFGQILSAIALAALIPVALAAFYYFVLACYSLLPRRIRELRGRSDSARFAVVIYARNAENEIAEAVGRIIDGMDYERSKFEVVVIADACDDSTAYVASFNGAKVLERRNEWKTGYAHALEWAIPILIFDGFDAVFALDIDCVPLANTLKLLDSAISAGYRAVRVPFIPTREQSLAAGLADVAANRINPSGRSKAGFSCELSLPGLCLSKNLLDKVPFAVDERGDISFYDAKLLMADEPIAFLSGAVVLRGDSGKGIEKTLAVPAARLLKASFDGNLAAFERLCAALSPKASTILAALLVVLLTGGVLMFSGGRFPQYSQLFGYGRFLVVVSSLAAVFLLFHLSLSFFTWYSDSILRKAAGNIRRNRSAHSKSQVSP
ncbi:MAG: glycosyltransferase [Kiritimatiellaeota bacterium]|nr:glycosyltransferase [Kiritimatiellota bacterium]